MPSDEFDQMWADGLHMLASEGAEPEHARVMHRVERRRRRRVAGSTALTAIACILAVGVASVTDGADSITTTDTSVEKSTTTALDPTSTTTTTLPLAPPAFGGGSPSPETGSAGDATATTTVAPSEREAPHRPDAPTTTVATSPSPTTTTTATRPPPPPAPPTPTTTTTVPWTYNPDGWALGGTVEIRLETTGLTATPHDVPLGLWRMRFLRGEGVNTIRAYVHVHDPRGQEYWLLHAGEYMHQEGILCPGTWTLRVTQGVDGPEIAPRVYLKAVGDNPQCPSGPTVDF